MESLSRPIWISISGHVAIVLLILFKAVFIPDIPFEIREAIRVDVVGLPDKLPELPAPVEEVQAPPPAKELPPKEVPPEPVAEAAKVPVKPTVPTPTAKKKPDLKNAQKEALDKIKRAQALDRIKSEVNTKAAKQQVVKGNQVAKGNSLTGLEQLDYERYYDEMNGKIREHWNLPEWLSSSNLKAQVHILVDERGYITRKRFLKSSGNEAFDTQVMAALESSTPLPPPPQRLTGFLSTSGIIINFPE